MGFFAVLLLGALVYFVWRIVDQMPDVVFRLGEIQRDIGEMRRQQERPNDSTAAPLPNAAPIFTTVAAPLSPPPSSPLSSPMSSPPGMPPSTSPPSFTAPD